MRIHAPILALSLAALLPLAGCNKEAPAPADDDPASAAPGESFVTRSVRAAMDRAARRLEEENISIGGRHRNWVQYGKDTSDLPRAEITPAGDLLIEGKAVAIDETQRQLLLAHRRQLVSVAQAGLALGSRGAELGVRAATGAVKAALTGKTGELEKRMEAEGKRIEAEASALVCGRLPGLLATQQALAAALPEFRPYARLEPEDVESCGQDGQRKRKLQVQAGLVGVGAEMSAGGDDPAGFELDAAAEADAAARDASLRM
ncbi:hypothetical protein [Pseudoxanthomonas sp. J31]|uniref:hypothetical protein n=1 Tax=Pseudoxanthomonas sp. J31 TaxID=935851 RepID=UPI00040EC85F|nr:hypothetical protein [Pseudoxanthomonas sp. J31]